METSLVLQNMNRRIIKNFLDLLILVELRESPYSGYDIIAIIHGKFHVLMSSGTVYSLLYTLEREGFVTGMWNERKRVYRLTAKGEETVNEIARANDKIRYLMLSLLKLKG